ncbi:MAG: 30S ribosomal protein S18, partial [Sulfurimonas sp.]|jgi:small subunit ribosomal protein S18|nr:30S ribosomal protein S18 [Sulfurimonas sp.]
MAEKRKYKKRYCKYCESKIDFMDYKDVGALRFSLSERYKIMPRRLTGNCKRHQDMIAAVVKRARAAALVPYSVTRHAVVTAPFENLR